MRNCSIIVTTYKSEASAERVVSEIRKLDKTTPIKLLDASGSGSKRLSSIAAKFDCDFASFSELLKTSSTNSRLVGYIKYAAKNNPGLTRTLGALDTHAENLLFLDDDAIVSKQILSYLNKTKPDKYATGFYLKSGFPDFSLLEWLKFYLYSTIANNHNAYKNFLADKATIPNTPGNSYIFNLITGGDPKLAKYIASIFDEVFLKGSYPKLDFNIRLPKRTAIDGACFMAKRELVTSVPFPTWYDEDWCWADAIKSIGCGMKFSVSSFNTITNERMPDKSRKINSIDYLIYEEKGKILHMATKACISKQTREKAQLEAAIQAGKEKRLQTLYGMVHDMEFCQDELELDLHSLIPRLIKQLERLDTYAVGCQLKSYLGLIKRGQ